MDTADARSEAASDRKLIDGYVSGSPEAIRTVGGWIRAELSDRFPVLRSDLQDLCQTVHEKLIPLLREGRFLHRSSLRTYVSRVARYTAVDLVRRRYRDRLYEEREGGARGGRWLGPYGSLLGAESSLLLRQVLLLAPAACRDLWRLAYMERLSYSEISRRLAIPAGTVKSRMWYCRRRALALLDELEGRTPAKPQPEVG